MQDKSLRQGAPSDPAPPLLDPAVFGLELSGVLARVRPGPFFPRRATAASPASSHHQTQSTGPPACGELGNGYAKGRRSGNTPQQKNEKKREIGIPETFLVRATSPRLARPRAALRILAKNILELPSHFLPPPNKRLLLLPHRREDHISTTLPALPFSAATARQWTDRRAPWVPLPSLLGEASRTPRRPP